MTRRVGGVAYEQGHAGAPGDRRGNGGDPAVLLTRLAQEAYAWARELDSAREQLPVPAAPAPEQLPMVVGGPVRANCGRQQAHAARDAIEEVMLSAAREVMVVHPGDDGGSRRLRDLIPLMSEAAEQGCRVRALLGGPVRSGVRHFADHINAIGGEVRTAQTPDEPILIVDQTALLLPSAVRAASAAAITQLGQVQLLRELTDLLWRSGTPMKQSGATPATPDAADADPATRELNHNILQLMANGMKDETIARTLGVSVRTCRRHIAEIMVGLNAVSRFQAGANAARLGLIQVDVRALRRPREPS